MPGTIVQPFKYLYSKFKGTDEFSALPSTTNIGDTGYNQWAYDTHHLGVAGTEEIVIYNIHGTASKPMAFQSLNDQLQQLFQIYFPWIKYTIKTPEFESRFTGRNIEEYTLQLKEQIYNTHDHTKKIVLIGHSRGGLICSYLAMITNLDILSIITIATPFKGTSLARLPVHWVGYPSSLSEMRRKANFHKVICTFIQSSELNFLHFGAVNDKVVKPDSCHPHHEPCDQIIELGKLILLDGHDHSSILRAPDLVIRVFRHIVDRIKLTLGRVAP